ncbi:hypothetical protein EBR21_02960, partial [bacterium]|nr:hypothetical protein [bacterium]
MILNSWKKIPGLKFRVLFALGLTALSPSSFAASFDPDGTEWTDARGFVQHLHALQSMPISWSSALQGESYGRSLSSASGCLRLSKPTTGEFEACSQVVLSALGNRVTSAAHTINSIRERFAVYISIVEQANSVSSWTAWLRAASVFVLLSDFERAERMLAKSKEYAQKDNEKNSWKLDRIAVFEHGLKSLKSEISSTAELPRLAFSNQVDPQSRFLLASMQSLVARHLSPGQTEEIGSERKIEDSRRMRWIIRQDRDEIENIRGEILQSKLNLELLRRIESICRQHQVESKEWQTVLSSVLGVSSRVEYLSRNDGLRLALDSWLSRDGQMDNLISFDDDPGLSRQGLVLDEFIKKLELILANQAKNMVRDEDKKVVGLLSERLAGMQSKVGRGLSRFAVDESIRRSILLKQNLFNLDVKLRTLTARLAAVDLVGTQIRNANGYEREIRRLSEERRSLLMEFVSSSLNLIPHSTAQYSSLKDKFQQLKKTLSDFERVSAGPSKRGFERTQAGLFVSESFRLIDRIGAESEAIMT